MIILTYYKYTIILLLNSFQKKLNYPVLSYPTNEISLDILMSQDMKEFRISFEKQQIVYFTTLTKELSEKYFNYKSSDVIF